MDICRLRFGVRLLGLSASFQLSAGSASFQLFLSALSNIFLPICIPGSSAILIGALLTLSVACTLAFAR